MLTFSIYLIGVVISVFLGLFVLLRNPRGVVNRIFFLFTIFSVLWIVSLFFLYTLTNNLSGLLFVGRLSYVAGAGAVYGLYLLGRNFPRRINSIDLTLDWVLGLETIILFIVTLFSDHIDVYESVVGGVNVTQYGDLFGWYIAHIVILFLTTIIVIASKYFRLRSGERSRLILFFVGMLIAVLVSTFTNLLLPLWGLSEFIPYGPMSVVVMVAMISYAIVRHGLLDITSVVARAVIYVLTLFVVVGFEALILIFGVKLLPENVDKVFVAASGAVVIVIGYDFVRSLIIKFTERIFYQGRYDTEDLLAKLTKMMASIIDIKKLSQKLLSTITSEMKISQGAFVLFSKHELTNIETVNWPGSAKLKNERLEKLMHGGEQLYIFEELEDGELKELFRNLGITVAMPLATKEGEIGLLLLGPKSSGDIYAERDLELLKIFAPQAAVAINNARAYQAIEQFSKTLEVKVDERTKELKELQRKELDRANELLKIKDEFVFIATHDLATPVTAIAGFVDLIKGTKKNVPKDVRDDIKAIDEATVRLRTLVNDLLEVARGESGTIKIKPVPVDIAAIIDGTAKLVEGRAKERKVAMNIKIDRKHKFVMADKAKLSEVVENLFSNAVKYNKDGGRVDVSSKKQGEKIVLEIADTGIGIRQSEQLKVFTKFFRSESDETRRQQGTGLGLFVVKMLVTKMGGKITFKSKEGEGTTFWVELKVAKEITRCYLPRMMRALT